MAVAKMIYFTGDLYERATEGAGKGEVSKRIAELIQKGLDSEKEHGKITLRDIIINLVHLYNSKKPNDKINIT